MMSAKPVSRQKSKKRRVTIIRKIKHRDGSIDVNKKQFHDLSVRQAV